MATDISNNVFDPLLVTELTDQTILSIYDKPTLVLFYDSTDYSCSWMCHILEQCARLCTYDNNNVSIASIDAYNYLDTVIQFTEMVPTLCLFLGRVPIIYTGLFQLSNIHLWLKAHTYTNCCPVTY
jgi:hypothetical protein